MHENSPRECNASSCALEVFKTSELHTEEEKEGVLDKQEAVMLAYCRANRMMGMLNEWAILLGSLQHLVEF